MQQASKEGGTDQNQNLVSNPIKDPVTNTVDPALDLTKELHANSSDPNMDPVKQVSWFLPLSLTPRTISTDLCDDELAERKRDEEFASSDLLIRDSFLVCILRRTFPAKDIG